MARTDAASGSDATVEGDATTGDDAAGSDFDAGRLARTLGLIAAVTAVILLTSASVLSGVLFQVAVVAMGSVALVTAITAALIAAAAALE